MPLFGAVGKKRKRGKPWYAHGKYWGPDWSGGKRQKSIDYRDEPDAPPPVDEDDYYAREHDAAYARAEAKSRSRNHKLGFGNSDLRDADFQFAKQEWGSGTVLGKIGAVGVGLQGVARGAVGAVDKFIHRRRIRGSPEIEANQLKESGFFSRFDDTMDIGRFPRPLRKVRKTRTNNASCLQTEYNGVAKGTHTVALGICSLPHGINKTTSNLNANSDSPWYTLALAILRRIWKKHYGVDVQSVFQTTDSFLPPVYRTQSTVTDKHSKLVSITFYQQTVSDSSVAYSNSITSVFKQAMPVTTDSTANRQVHKVARDLAANLYAYFGKDIGNSNEFRTTRMLYGYALEEHISLTSATLTDPSNRVMSSIFRMDNWIVSLKYKTTIRIQNISNSSAAPTAGGDLITANEANKLTGVLYHFKDPYPVPNTAILSVLHTQTVGGVTSNGVVVPGSWEDVNAYYADQNGDGIVNPQSATGTTNNGVTSYSDSLQLRHIPKGDAFKNVSGYTPISISPGGIRTYRQSFSFNGYINKLIEGLSNSHHENITVFSSARKRMFGTHDLFCFQDYLGAHGHETTSGDPPVAISFQINRFSSCIVVKNVQTGMEVVRDYTTPVSGAPMDT